MYHVPENVRISCHMPLTICENGIKEIGKSFALKFIHLCSLAGCLADLLDG